MPGVVAEVVQRGHDEFARSRGIEVRVAVRFDDGFVRRLVKADQMAEIRIEALADDLNDFLRVGDGIVGLKGEQRLRDRLRGVQA